MTSRINIGDSIETVRIGGGVYPTLALVNHSCDPNFVIVFWGRVAVAVASRCLTYSSFWKYFGEICTKYMFISVINKASSG